MELKEIVEINKKLSKTHESLKREYGKLAKEDNKKYKIYDKEVAFIKKEISDMANIGFEIRYAAIEYLKCDECGADYSCEQDVKSIRINNGPNRYSACKKFKLPDSVIPSIILEHFPHTENRSEYYPPSGYSDHYDPYGTPGGYHRWTVEIRRDLIKIRDNLLNKNKREVKKYIWPALYDLKKYKVTNPAKCILDYVNSRIKALEKKDEN